MNAIVDGLRGIVRLIAEEFREEKAQGGSVALVILSGLGGFALMVDLLVGGLFTVLGAGSDYRSFGGYILAITLVAIFSNQGLKWLRKRRQS